jgi:hypothetical protein
MTPGLIATLMTIAKDANNWPQTRHLRDEALRALESAHVCAVEMIQPVMVVDRFTEEKAEAEPAARRNS